MGKTLLSIEKVSGQGRRTVGKDRFFLGSGDTVSPLAACLWPPAFGADLPVFCALLQWKEGRVPARPLPLRRFRSSGEFDPPVAMRGG